MRSAARNPSMLRPDSSGDTTSEMCSRSSAETMRVFSSALPAFCGATPARSSASTSREHRDTMFACVRDQLRARLRQLWIENAGLLISLFRRRPGDEIIGRRIGVVAVTFLDSHFKQNAHAASRQCLRQNARRRPEQIVFRFAIVRFTQQRVQAAQPHAVFGELDGIARMVVAIKSGARSPKRSNGTMTVPCGAGVGRSFSTLLAISPAGFAFASESAAWGSSDPKTAAGAVRVNSSDASPMLISSPSCSDISVSMRCPANSVPLVDSRSVSRKRPLISRI